MPYEHLLTVFDGTPESEDLLDMVCRIAKPSRSRLTILIVKVVPLIQPLSQYVSGKDPGTDKMVAYAEKFAEKRGVKAATAVRYARALGTAVISEVRVRGVDLVALLAPDIGTLTSESTSAVDIDNVLHHATCAVMLCRPGELSER